MTDLNLNFTVTDEKNSCKGLIFRGYKSVFYSNGRFEQRQGIRLLKKESCPGCEKCQYLLDDAKEFVNSESLIFPDIEHGKKYMLMVTNIHTDFESGIVDDYDIEITECGE